MKDQKWRKKVKRAKDKNEIKNESPSIQLYTAEIRSRLHQVYNFVLYFTYLGNLRKIQTSTQSFYPDFTGIKLVACRRYTVSSLKNNSILPSATSLPNQVKSSNTAHGR